ncbi:MAG: hypothetical protein AB1327_09795 [Bacillota bacterium]|uniref:hypothetical protein n=1 Tax=Desulforudis sp. DRI-14 TaxID=3459793 RepID=UPI0034824F60
MLLKKTSWVTELLLTFFYVAYFVAANEVLKFYSRFFQTTFNPKPFLLAATLVPMLFGAALVVPAFIASGGKLRVNFQRLLIQGIPALLIGVPVPLYAWEALNQKWVFWWPLQSETYVITLLSAVWFGWVVMSSIERAEGNHPENSAAPPGPEKETAGEL